MGAQCSSTARSRFEAIKTLVMRKACLTSYTATGLLPRGDNGPLIWMFGEDHLTNEAVKHASAVRKLHERERANFRGKNCLLLLDVATEAASSCQGSEEANADVIFLYENAVIDAERFAWADPDEWQGHNKTGLISTRWALKSMTSTKDMVESRPAIHAEPNTPDPSLPPSLDTMPKSLDFAGRVRLANDNVKPVPMDVFHRMRSFLIQGYRQPGVYTPSIAVGELVVFWESVGYHAPDLVMICTEAEKLAMQYSSYFAEKNFDQRVQYDIYEALVCVSLAKLSFERRVSSETDYGWLIGKKMALRELDDRVTALFNDQCVFNPSLKIPSRDKFESGIAASMGIELPSARDYRQFALGQLAIQLVGMSGDMIVYEYISSLVASKQNSTIVLMNAGYQHTNAIQRWLLAGQYDVAHNRVSDDALADEDFTESRGPFSFKT